jgi:hypothetical protein
MWWWILGWVLLVLLALAFHGWLGWRLVKKGVRLGRQLAESADRAALVRDVRHEPYRPAASVLAEPAARPSSGSSTGPSSGPGTGRPPNA